MAIKYGNWVWEGQSTEAKPGYEDGAGDGHVFKELDTGESYTMVDGSWVYINLGLAFIKATKSGTTITDSSGDATITFVTPFIDANYTVALGAQDTGGPPNAMAFPFVVSKATANFIIKTRGTNNLPLGNITVSWVATRDYNP